MKNQAQDSKRSRGAQPGNINAVRYPWRVLFKRGVLKDDYRLIEPWMNDYKRGLIEDKGGAENMSNAEIYIANIAERAYGSQLIILAEAGRKGFTRQLDSDWDLQPGFKDSVKYMQVELKALQTFGTKRRPKDVPSIDEIDWTQPPTDSPESPNGQTASNGGVD